MSDDDKALRLFVSDLIKAKGSDKANEEELVAILSQAIDDAIMSALPDESIKAIADANDNPSDDSPTVEQLIEEAGINQDEIISGVLKEFRDAYLSEEYDV